MINDQLNGVVELLGSIKEDNSVPKNIRFKIESTLCLLKTDCEDCLKISQVLNELEDISNDPNIPSYTRVEILNIVGILSNGE
ncbi:MAG: UPF0147 family protein [Nanoarchaeota archaeon]|nr:UPF0147 family protein [Nanoarchaeota archaeon]